MFIVLLENIPPREISEISTSKLQHSNHFEREIEIKAAVPLFDDTFQVKLTTGASIVGYANDIA